MLLDEFELSFVQPTSPIVHNYYFSLWFYYSRQSAVDFEVYRLFILSRTSYQSAFEVTWGRSGEEIFLM